MFMATLEPKRSRSYSKSLRRSKMTEIALVITMVVAVGLVALSRIGKFMHECDEEMKRIINNNNSNKGGQ